MLKKKILKTGEEVKPCGALSVLPGTQSLIPLFYLFTVTLTTFDPDLQWKREERMGRVNEKGSKGGMNDGGKGGKGRRGRA